MMCLQAATDTALNMVQIGELPDMNAANVQIVRLMGVRIIRGKVPRDIRKALNAAVKEGKLGHLKKEGLKPEVYFHPNSRQNAIAERNKAVREATQALLKVCI